MRNGRSSRAIGATGRSAATPRPPQICWARSATRASASPANVLAMDVSFDPAAAVIQDSAGGEEKRPSGGKVDLVVGDHLLNHAEVSKLSRRTRLCTAASSTATSCARLAVPVHRMTWVIRAGPNLTWAYRNPRSGSPKMASSPTSTLSNVISAATAHHGPVLGDDMSVDRQARGGGGHQEHRGAAGVANLALGACHHDEEPSTVRSGDESLRAVQYPAGRRAGSHGS